MPQIIVTADPTTEPGSGSVMWRERITPADMESSHFTAQLVERLGWAVGDAVSAETPREPNRRDESSDPEADYADYAEDDSGQRPRSASRVTTASYTPAP